MAVTPMIRDFLPRFRRQLVWLFISLHLVLVAITAGMLWWLGHFETELIASLIILAVQFLGGLGILLIIVKAALKPTKQLIATITHIAGEPTATTPPNPNEKRFEKSGFRLILQTLYTLAANRPDTEAKPQEVSNPEQTTVEQNSSPATRTGIEKALDDTICGFVTLNQERHITYANKATPIRVDSDGKMHLDILFSDSNTLDSWWNECAESTVRAEKTWARVSNKLPNEEGRRFFDIIASYDKGAENEVVLVLIDRTHLYSIGEEELDFIAFAAHELRGPITVIRGYLDVLQDELSEVLQDDQKELFRRLAVSANRLSGYINNILNTSRFDRRHLKMHLIEANVAQVYDTIRDDMALRASSQNRLLTVTIPTDIPTIAADTASLSEVLGNLIDNAIKYSNEGGAIQVSAALHGDMVDIIIEDHGIGMPGNVISNLFQKFYRSHRSRETVAGTGIGLYISKAIVESHGGTISVRSEEGKGSVFTVSLPTYRSVADKIESGDNESVMKKTDSGVYIKNHAAYRG